MRIFAVVFVLVSWLAVERAHACGFWSMTDTEKQLTIGWLVNSASIEKGDKRWAALYLDIDNPSGIRVAKDHKVVYDVKKDGTVVRYGKPIGKVTADGVTFGKRAYSIALTDHQLQESVMHTWTLTVKRGDDVVVTSKLAAGLCNAMKHDSTEDSAAEEVRRRVIYYLAWRETGL